MLKSDALRRVQMLNNGGKEQPVEQFAPSNSLTKSNGPAVIVQSVDIHGEGARHRQSLSDAAGAGGSQGQINHSNTVLSRSMTDKISMLDRQESIEKEPIVVKVVPRPQWKIKIEKLLENYYWVGAMTVVTFYALFMDDLRLLCIDMSADLTIDIFTIVCMSLYLIELFLGIIAVENYFMSFYFWVDLISLLSMVPDISFLMTEIEGGIGGAGDGADVAKTGRATRVIKIIRIIRLIRLLRVMKIYKAVKTGQKTKNRKIQQQRESKRLARKKGNSLGQLNTGNLAAYATTLDGNESTDSFIDEVKRVDKDFADKILEKDLMLEKRGGDINGKESEEEGEDNDASNLSNNASAIDGKKKKTDDDEEEEGNDQLESNISKALSDKITKVVVILVLIMLFLMPILDHKTFLTEQLTHDNTIVLLLK